MLQSNLFNINNEQQPGEKSDILSRGPLNDGALFGVCLFYKRFVDILVKPFQLGHAFAHLYVFNFCNQIVINRHFSEYSLLRCLFTTKRQY